MIKWQGKRNQEKKYTLKIKTDLNKKKINDPK